MKEWYTNSELADLSLPGFPDTESGIASWFKKRDLDGRFPNRVRRRKGRGGGIERHMALLPRPIQSLLTIGNLETAKAPPIDEIFEQAHQIPAPPVTERGELKRAAILLKSVHRESLLKLTDPDAWKNKKRFSGTNMNHWVSRPNQLWEIDASPADVLLTDGRYSIYAVIDIYTRRMMVTVTKTPKTAAVLVLARRAIMAWGVPEILRTDNGSDFISHEFKRALSSLAIHQDITDPFSPEQKGTVERAIGTLQRGLMPLLPGFIGHNVADRKKIEARKSFAARLGESDEKAFCVELSQEELQTKVDHWLTAKYEHKAHGGLKGKTPFETMAAWNGKVRAIESQRMLDVMLAPITGKDGFPRGWDNGRGVDSGRVFGSFQADLFAAHQHISAGSFRFPYGGAGNKAGNIQSRPPVTGLTGSLTSSAGGTETRPRNVAVDFHIKY